MGEFAETIEAAQPETNELNFGESGQVEQAGIEQEENHDQAKQEPEKIILNIDGKEKIVNQEWIKNFNRQYLGVEDDSEFPEPAKAALRKAAENLISLNNKNIGNSKQASEAAAEVKNLSDYIMNLKSNPEQMLPQFLKDIGLGDRVTDILEKTLHPIYLRDEMNPDQKRAWELENQTNEYKSELERIREREEQAKAEADSAQWKSHYQSDITGALTKFGIPVNGQMIAEIAGFMKPYVDQGRPITAEMALQRMIENSNKFLSSLPEDKFGRLADPGLIDRARKLSVDNYKNKSNPASTSYVSDKMAAQEPKFTSIDDIFEHNRRKFR